MRPDDDFQHLPSWRELVVATALSLRRHHADTLIVPISLIRDAYRARSSATWTVPQVMTELSSGDAQPIAQDVTGQPLCSLHLTGRPAAACPARPRMIADPGVSTGITLSVCRGISYASS